MNNKNSRVKSTALRIALLLTTMVYATPSFAVNADKLETVQFSTSERTSLQKQGEFQLAQAAGSCYQVIARNGLDVRRDPTVYSEAIGIINYGRNVTVEPGRTRYWIPISAPLQGYVYANWLAPCGAASLPPNNCRQVVARTSAPVRQEPSITGEIIGSVASGRRVTIENLGADGWGAVSVPLRGYIASEYLAYCRPSIGYQ
ncbi:SH3 domain-containing protein [Microcoleus sp. herbarium7]|uniref:SH3 domain-containing protein n=1 Tax=Microcoleus sp. herbarium7 TaxID=3055435 RepID=UPI002FD45DE9